VVGPSELSGSEEVAAAGARDSQMYVQVPAVNWSFIEGDYAIFDSSPLGEMFRSGMENESDWDRAELNSLGDLRWEAIADRSCSLGAYSGDCHVGRISIEWLNVTGYNDSEGTYMTFNYSSYTDEYFPPTLMARGYSEGELTTGVWMGFQSGQELYRSSDTTTEAIETETSGQVSNYTVDDTWTERQHMWENDSSVTSSQSWDGTSWQSSQNSMSSSEESWENTTYTVVSQTQVESPGYNKADPNGAGPTTFDVLLVNESELDDADDVLNTEYVHNAEFGFPVTMFGAPIQEWHVALAHLLDADGDGVHDLLDDCANTPDPHTELDEAGCSWEQKDDDGDSILNPDDDCADTDALGMTDIDASGCAWEQRDEDGDGILNNLDFCPGTPAGEAVDTDGMTRGCSETQKDSDGDGVSDANDTCPGFNDSIDLDGDGIVDGCDPIIDSDGDMVADVDDICPGYNDSIDLDDDGIPDGCDPLVDSDRDDVADVDDQCPGYDDAIDVDGDGIIDGCDDIIDSDGDGVEDSFEMCPGFDDSIDVDADGTPDGCDSIIDSDFDFVANDDDECPDTQEGALVNDNGCSPAQLDTDSDGVNDAEDRCPITPGGTHDADGDGCPDDSDGDGILDVDDGCTNSTSIDQVDSTGCVPDTSLFAGGFGGKNSILLGGLAALLVAIILIVTVIVIRRGRESDEYNAKADLFESVSAPTLKWSGAGMPSRKPSSQGSSMPTSGAPAEPSSPHVAQVGEVQPDGYEYLEHPPDSGSWWYRDQQTNHWEPWKK
jgi:hypothetical protein